MLLHVTFLNYYVVRLLDPTVWNPQPAFHPDLQFLILLVKWQVDKSDGSYKKPLLGKGE